MKKSSGFLAAVVFLAAVLCASSARAAVYTYTGNGVAGDWADPDNWGGSGAPVNVNDHAIIPDGFSPTFTTGFPTTPTLTHFQTGDGMVTLPSSLKMIYQGSPWRSDTVDIGSGGLTIVSGGVEMSSEQYFRSAGPVTMNHLYMVNRAPEQTGTSTWDIATIRLGNNAQPGYEVRAWNILDGANTTFMQAAGNGSSTTWVGSPVISGGRPNWNLTQAAVSWSQAHGLWNLQNYELYGNIVQLDGMNGSNPRLIGNGATVDVNVLRIAYGYNSTDGRAYVDLANSTVLIQGTGTSSFPAYDNRSQRNELFDLTDGTTVTLTPTNGSMFISTGSRDRGGANASDWDDNFAFGNLHITENSTVTVTGNATIEGGDPSALYVKGTLYGEHNSTIAGGRNIYVYGGLEPGSSAGTMNIEGNLHLWETALLTFDLSDPDVVGGGVNDLVAIDGDLTLNGLLEVNLDDPMLLGNYTLFTYTGELYGNGLQLLTELPKPTFVDTSVAGMVTLNVVPEPTSLALLGLGGLALLKRRRR